MTGQQRAVLWIGLILVGLNLVGHWKEITAIIFSGAGITQGIGGSSSGGGGGIPFPGLPFPFNLAGQGSQKTKTTLM